LYAVKLPSKVKFTSWPHDVRGEVGADVS